jgi:hypothetical protein
VGNSYPGPKEGRQKAMAEPTRNPFGIWNRKSNTLNTQPSGGNSTDLLAAFTPEEIGRLFRLQSAVAQGRCTETTPEYKRLAFARWLVQQGRLTD